MTTDSPGLGTTSTHTVTLSQWVNEGQPPLTELLTSHETVRRTKRHHWTLAALALLGCFPRKLKFQGRSVGWLRTDIDCWLGRNHRLPKSLRRCRHSKCRERNGHRICVSPAVPVQQCLFRHQLSASTDLVIVDLARNQPQQDIGRRDTE